MSSKFLVPLELLDINSTPSLPGTDWHKLYFKNNNLKVLKNTERDLVLDRLLDSLLFTACTPILSTDTVIQAFGKIQCQINNLSFTQVNADWNSISGPSEILNKPVLSIVAITGDYLDLINLPSIPAAQVNSDWNSISGISQILNKPVLATVATTGSYLDLSNTPTIPSAQVNSDWNATSGVSEILNKPNLDLATFTIELLSSLTVNFYAPFDVRINSISLINGTGTITILVNSSPYTLTNLIYQGDEITVSSTNPSVVNLNSEYE